VLLLQPPSPNTQFPFTYYFIHPITPEGIPSWDVDAEYLLKPPLERIPAGEARRFYDLCKAKNLVQIDGNNFVFNEALYREPELHDPLVQLYGKPLDILNRKVSQMKTSSGAPVRFLFCSTHTGIFRPNLEDPQIWVDAVQRYHIPFLDLNGEMTALGLSYFPLSEVGQTNHLNPDGHLLLGRLLAHQLIREKIIPFEAGKK
jgi:hypothetical protein